MRYWLFSLIFAFTFSFANEPNNNTITALMPQNFPPYFKLDKNNNPTGFAVEVFKQVAKKSNIDYKIVVKPNYAETENAFLNKEADIIIAGGISKTRKENSIFTVKFDSSVIKAYKLKTTKIKSIDDFNLYKLCLKNNNIAVKLFKDFPKDKLTMVSSKEEGLVSLLSKKSDIFVINVRPFEQLLFSLKLDDVIAPLDTIVRKVDFAIRVQKGKKELHKKLNTALKDFLTTREYKKLYEKWIGKKENTSTEQIMLTNEEKEYLENKKIITLGFHTKWPPYLIKSSNNKYIGITPDIYEIVSKRLGIKFKYKIYENIKETIQSVKKDKIDIIPIMSKSAAENSGFKTIKAIVTNHLYVYVNKDNKLKKISSMDDLKGLKVAYADTRIRLDKFLMQYKDSMHLVKTDNSLDAFFMLKNKKVDVVIDKYASKYLLFKNLLQNDIKTTYLVKELLSSSVIAINSENPILKSILTKAINSINFKEQQIIINKWLKFDDSNNKKDFQLSSEERLYLDNNEFTICDQYNIYPISGVKDEKLVGMSGDYLDLISNLLNVDFKVISPKDAKDLEKKVTQNQCDMISILASNQKRFSNMKNTNVINRFSIAAMGGLQSNYIDDRSNLADYTFVARFNSLKDKVLSKYPNLDIEVINNIDSALSKLNEPKTQFLAIKPVIEHIIQTYGIDKFKINGTLNSVYPEFTMGVHSNHELLLSIINKAIEHIDPQQIQQINDKYTIKEFKIEKNYNIYLLYSLIFLAILIIFIFLRSKTKIASLNAQKAKELNEQKKILVKAQEIAHMGSWQQTFDNDTLNWSDEVYNMFELDLNSNLTFERFLEIVHPDDRQKVSLTFQKSVEEHKEYYLEHRLLFSDGRIKYVIERAEHFYDENNNHVGSLGTVQDITEKKKLEIEAKEKDNLLYQQSKLAAMGEMIGMIAHQWRQPLTSISMDATNMLVDIELENFNTINAEKYANRITEQTQHLSHTIDNFRNFFKPDKELIKINMNQIIDNTLLIVENSLKNHNIELTTSFETDKSVKAYPRELMQVFVNIINNSKDALISFKPENALISIRVYEDDKYINTEICDNGGGIKDNILPKIFDPYFSTKDEKNGTGLGLYMSKMIIENHLNGTIDIYNKNEGACFSIKLLKG